MAGMIFLADGRDWSASSSIFYWLLDTLAERAGDTKLADRLREISENNLGSIDLSSLDDVDVKEFIELAIGAPQFAREDLPDTPHRDAIVSLIESLASMFGEN